MTPQRRSAAPSPVDTRTEAVLTVSRVRVEDHDGIRELMGAALGGGPPGRTRPASSPGSTR